VILHSIDAPERGQPFSPAMDENPPYARTWASCSTAEFGFLDQVMT